MTVSRGYSSRVALTLVVGGVPLCLSHVNPGEWILRDPCEPVGAYDAELIIQVDDEVTKQQVFLPKGISGSAQWIKYF